MISENFSTYLGKQVVDFQPGVGIERSRPVVHRLRVDSELYWDNPDEVIDVAEQVKLFADDPYASSVSELIIGAWDFECDEDSSELVAALVACAPKLANLQALMIGDVTYEELEMSWIQQSSLESLLQAYPRLQRLHVRGGQSLSLGTVAHNTLNTLIIETGGLPAAILQQLASGTLPQLAHLELWLGTDNYGWDGTIADVEGLLRWLASSEKLTYLGLRNSDIADEVAVCLANNPWPPTLRTLDLSMGTLGDRGAQALLDCAQTTSLKALNLKHHYCSDAVMTALAALPVDVNLDEREDDDDRYVEVGE